MFTMMNHARLGVGLQGLGLSERALPGGRQLRVRAPPGPHRARPVTRGESADPIIVHPDVRRALLRSGR